jgi:hypothetical protein
MVATTQHRAVKRRPRPDVWRDSIPGVRIATDREGRRLFDHQARKTLGLSGEEFLEKWDRGDFRRVTDPVEVRKIRSLAMLIPGVRRTRA